MPFHNGRIDWSAVAFYGFFVLSVAFVAFMVVACSDTEPEEREPFIGEWAGTYTADGVELLITLSIREDGTYTALRQNGADTLARESGEWKLGAGNLLTKPKVCEAGPTLHLVSCPDYWDQTPTTIHGQEWVIHFVAGGAVRTVTLLRVG